MKQNISDALVYGIRVALIQESLRAHEIFGERVLDFREIFTDHIHAPEHLIDLRRQSDGSYADR